MRGYTMHNEAHSLLVEGRVDEALLLLLKAHAHDSSPQTLGALAEAYALRGNWDKAEVHARQWISAEPASAPARLLHVIALTVLGRRDDAEREAQPATSADSGSPLTWAAAAYAGLPTRDPRKHARPNVEQPWQATQRCAALDNGGPLSQSLHGLVAFAANDPKPRLPSGVPGTDPSMVDAIRWLATAEHSLGFDATALMLYDVLLEVDPGDRLALARAVQIARTTTLTGALVSNPWVVAFLPAHLGIGNLYVYMYNYSMREHLPALIARALRADILWRRAHSALRPLVGAVLTVGGGYFMVRAEMQWNATVSLLATLLFCVGAWLFGSWVHARWLLRRGRAADLSRAMIDLVGRDTLPLKRRSLTWPLAAAIGAAFGIFFFSMGFKAENADDRPLGLVAGPIMVGAALWVARRWLMVRRRLRHPVAPKRTT